MFRSVAAKVAWVGRTAAMVFGLALVLGLVFGVASVALGANGGNFILGKKNVATALTRLTGNVNGAAMQITNNNAGANDTALDLSVQPGEAPMKVNSGTKVANLNADTLDGVDSTEIDAKKLGGVFPEEIGRQYWAGVNADGTIRRTNPNGVLINFSGKIGTGTYYLLFVREVDNCAYAATTTDGFAGQTGARLNDDGAVIVNTANSDGSRGDLPFSVIVTC